MKRLFWVCLCALVSFGAAGQSDINLGGKVMTFTNLQGRVFANVRLDRATLDGVIYSLADTNAIGGGMVKYKDLSTNFLADLNIPADRIQIALQRDKVRAAQKQRYNAELQALALKQQQDSALAFSNALVQASNSAANPTAASTAKQKKGSTHGQ
jgi:hypothetical protein